MEIVILLTNHEGSTGQSEPKEAILPCKVQRREQNASKILHHLKDAKV